jgi:hypothetical protein
MAQNRNEPELPRAEPEILPPDRGRSGGRSWPPYGDAQARGTHRIYVTRIGPFGFALAMLAVGLLAAVFLLLIIGTALLWLPVVIGLAVIAAIFRIFRR